tara:strand:+ start:688 stop:2337 length:1650 start_codon:yes stop_codon:yes gene_type:complete
MKIILILCITFIYSQCDQLAQYSCSINPQCEWKQSQESGDCSDLNQSECLSGQYNYCYWNSSYNKNDSSCIGGRYILNQGECIESRNILDNYVSGKIDDALVNFFMKNGFQKKYINNRTYLTYENIEISYSDINTNSSGVKIISPEIRLNERDVSLLTKLDFISINLSMNDIITYIEQLIYYEQMPQISYLDLHFNNIVTNIENKREGNVEFKVNDIRAIFDGYLNQKIFEDIDRGVRIPSNNQSINLSMKGFEIIRAYDKKGQDLLLGILELFSLESLRYSLYKIDNAELKAAFLPSQNKIEGYFNFNHPHLGFDLYSSSNAEFNFIEPEDTKWKSGEIDANAYLALPSHIDLSLYKIPLFQKSPILPASLPGKINIGFNAVYDDDLSTFIQSIDREDPIIDNNAKLQITAGLNNLSFDFANPILNNPNLRLRELRELKNISYTRFNIDNFNIDGGLSNSKLELNSNFNTNFFNARLTGDIDVFDPENPWINKLNLSISNINPVCESIISLIERESNIRFNRSYNNIDINLTGYVHHPTIKGFTIIND